MNIITDSPATVVMKNDTLKNMNNQTHIEVLRQQKPIMLEVFNDTISKNITISAKNSFAFWSNLGFCYGLGMLIDMNNPKRYTFPNTVYISMKNNDSNYSAIDSASIRNKYIVKWSPTMSTGFVNPGIELSCERRTGNYFATQVMASYLLPVSVWGLDYAFKPKIKGYRLAIEEKFYFKKSAPIGPYTSLELNYLKTQYRAIEWFSLKNVYIDSTFNQNASYGDTIGINKQTFSINIKLGYQYFFKRFSFDCYVGLGLRYKDVSHFDRINPKDEMEIPTDLNFSYITNLNGHYWTAIIPLNFKIGWTF